MAQHSKNFKNFKDTDFYDRASGEYSAARYPNVAESYAQFFFKRRMALALRELALFKKFKKNSPEDADFSLLEIGCADGVILRQARERFGDVFTSFLGVDISPKMIEAARNFKRNFEVPEKNVVGNMAFKMRDEIAGTGESFDAVLEIGVINYASLSAEEEIAEAARRVKDGGYFVCSIAGKGSLWDRRNCARGEENGFQNFLSYREYEAILGGYFEIKKKIPVGFFVPFLWRIPALARIVQPLAENLFLPLFPNLFHEKMYVCRNQKKR